MNGTQNEYLFIVFFLMVDPLFVPFEVENGK